MFEKETEFYIANKNEIREKYLGKRIVIAGDQIIGVYNDVSEAYTETIKTLLPGSFMIKDIPVDIEDEVVQLSPFIF